MFDRLWINELYCWDGMTTVNVWLGQWLEEEWKEREAQNNVVQWGAEVTGWEATPPASPVARVDVTGAGIWPTPEALVEEQVTA
jgi:hypothetical protein